MAVDPPTETDDELANAATRPDRGNRPAIVSPSSSVDNYRGELIGDRYRVEKLLGRGGMGVVYLAIHEQIDKRFAIKVLPRQQYSDSRAARFEREAKSASKIGQENIVNITDFGRTKRGDFYLVMELLEGRDLAVELDARKSLSIERSIAIARQVCRALEAAHQKGIIHRDLKPANLFLVRRGRGDFVKVLDFGLASVESTDGKRLTEVGAVMGTAQYMAPEQARGDKLDGRADVYALGCVLYEMLSGIAPFAAPTYAEALELQLSYAPPPPSEHRPEVGAALDAVVMRALEKIRLGASVQ